MTLKITEINKAHGEVLIECSCEGKFIVPEDALPLADGVKVRCPKCGITGTVERERENP